MSDLMQIQHEAMTDGTEPTPMCWRQVRQSIVPASNRRRILDREADMGFTPNADGWLTSRRNAGYDHLLHQDVVHWVRLRWEDPRLFAGTVAGELA